MADLHVNEEARFSDNEKVVTGLVAMVFIVVATLMGYDMRGPDFLGFYFVVFLITLGALWLLRRTWRDHPAVTIAAIGVYEGIGFLRIVTGLPRGMYRFQGLIVMMLLGGFVQVLRAKYLPSITSGSGGGDSCGSSCGGGGCGGGGGGCGGCGG